MFQGSYDIFARGLEGGFYLGSQLVANGGHVSQVSWKQVGANVLGGAAAGAVAGATGGLSLFGNAALADATAGGVATVVGTLVTGPPRETTTFSTQMR